MTVTLPAPRLLDLGTRLFEAAGAPAAEAQLVARELVASSLLGCDSHGVLRIPQYLDEVERGVIIPGAAITVAATSATTASVDGGFNFGAVGATRAMETAIDIAGRARLACVITRHVNHVGRLGAYPQLAARAGFIALATCNSPIYGHFVLPWGGREGRLGTNPIAYAVPTATRPIVADISTSVVPEGKVRACKNAGLPLAAGWAVDHRGQPAKTASDFYGPPRGGLLPLGGAAGHKGFALGLLVEILGTALAGASATDPHTVGNGVCFFVLDPSAFCPIDRFKELMDELVAYQKSSPPVEGVDQVQVPGEPELRTQEARWATGVDVDDVTWASIQAHAARLGVTVSPAPSEPAPKGSNDDHDGLHRLHGLPA